jgi:ActR/RegA family two-component response regulator
MTAEEKQREEEKRNRMYDPVLRWKHIQEAITWAELNMPEQLRRNRPRVPKSRQTPQPSSAVTTRRPAAS